MIMASELVEIFYKLGTGMYSLGLTGHSIFQCYFNDIWMRPRAICNTPHLGVTGLAPNMKFHLVTLLSFRWADQS